jgi:hypothetical protein
MVPVTVSARAVVKQIGFVLGKKICSVENDWTVVGTDAQTKMWRRADRKVYPSMARA